MTAIEKQICTEVLRDATSILRHEEFECEGKKVIQFTVIYEGEKYSLTKHDGEWVYFFHWNK